MAKLIIKKPTPGDQRIDDMGVTVPGSGQLVLTNNVPLQLDAGRSQNLVTLVQAGTLVINDGSTDVPAQEGLNLIAALWSSAARQQLAPLPPRFVQGARLGWVSVTQVEAGTIGKLSVVQDKDNSFAIRWPNKLAADITVAGAGGLQTGQVEAADTWYQVYAIDDSTGVNPPALLLVPEGVAFNEAGYDKARRIGWVRNDGSSNLLKFIQTGNDRSRRVMYDEPAMNTRVLNNGNALAFSTVSLAAFVPQTSHWAFMGAAFTNSLIGLAGDTAQIRPGGATGVPALVRIEIGVLASADLRTQFQMATDDAQNIEYRVSQLVNQLDLFVQGYYDEL